MAQNELNKLFSGGARFEDLVNSLKSNKSNLGKLRPSLGQALWTVPTAVTANKIPSELGRYFKSLGDYGGKSLDITGNRLDKEEARRIIKDFNSLYFGGDKDRGVTAPFIRAITEPGGGTKYPQNIIGAIDYKESQPKTKQEEPKQTITNQYQFDPLTGLPVLPGGEIGLNNMDDEPILPLGQVQDFGYVQQTPHQQQTSGNTIDDIIALAQAQQQLRNEQMVPYIEALQEAMEKYSEGQNRNFFRDLGLAGLSGLTGNQAYTKIIGSYNENKPM